MSQKTPTPRDTAAAESWIDLRDAVAKARQDEAFLGAVRDLLAQADAETDVGGACNACGACCDFASAGHRLYVSVGELALLTEFFPPETPAPLRCPYQVGPRCSARDQRPLGCRIYFCRDRAAEASRERYEVIHQRLRSLHDSHGMAYHYMELTAALAQVLAGRGVSDTSDNLP